MFYVPQKKSTFITSLLLIGVFFLQTSISLIPEAGAYDSTDDTFIYYKLKIEGLLQDLEREFRVNNSVTDASINNIRKQVQEAYYRLPDRGSYANTNSSIEKSVELYLDLAQKNKSSQTFVSNAATQTARFLNEAKIEQITGSITANPASGNAPLTTSFFATAKDPSGVVIPDGNYIWWMRERGGVRKELGRGPLLTYTFSKEGNYQVFLDVVSDSRNSRGKIDVLPLTSSQDIEVRPRLGNVILLVNGVNVSNLDQIKISPAVGKIGVLFDATASRAVSNGVISKTEWDFGNGNSLKYDGPPIVERQIFANEGSYRVTLNITSNQGQPFKKEITLVVRDPSAVITTDKESAYLGEEIRMTAKTYLSNTANVEYSWQVQDDVGKKIITSQEGSIFTYKFQKVGQYVVTLTSKSPNGSTDTDSRTITIESHVPTVNLDSPYPISKERPNVIVFDASRSFDLDTKSAKGLTYTWVIDGEKVDLDNIESDGGKGTYTFNQKGQHTVSLTVANSFGKVTNVDRTFEVNSLLTVGVNINPRAAPIGTPITFQARAPQASFYEWDFGDGTPPVNGNLDSLEHVYNRTGVYTMSLHVKNVTGSEENYISRAVYITDTDSPFALIDIGNGSNTIIENPNGCESSGTGGAFLINRSESTNIDGSKSVNIDGNASGLNYTWRYLGRVKTGASLYEKFTELGCFPIELTVKSQKNGSSHTSKRFLEIRNQPPKLTSITSNIDTTKKDSQKLIVSVNANGAKDEDGVITSYVWYYTTESDSEKQNVKITQLPNTSFVLPNISEKYYFGVILEDNDGARIDSAETLAEQIPLITSNDEANINMPLINLSVDKTQVLTEDMINFSVTAKNILGADITGKSEYYWDFDGDGHTDKRSPEANTSYSYKNSGRYNMKVKVVNNGVSNTKYQVIYVKNELKAAVKGYHFGDAVYFVNTSKGSYDKVQWEYAGNVSENQYSFMLPWPMSTGSGQSGTFTVKAGANEISTTELTESVVEDIIKPEDGIAIQTYPKIENDVVTVEGAGEKILISAFGNDAKEYVIDIDTKIDSDLDGVPDNDKDNKDTPSYTDGSVFAITNLGNVKTRNREIKVSLIGNDSATIGVKKIPIVFNYIPGNNNDTTDITASGVVESFSNVDKANLEQLQTKIRSLESDDRIIFTQKYNTLIENWNDLHERTQNLLDIQKEVDESTTLDDKTKEALSKLIDIILVGDAQATNEISVASRVIEGLIKIDNPDRDYIIERLEQIKSHPANLVENKALGKEILLKVEANSDLSNADKLLLKSQLQIIVNGCQECIPDSEVIVPLPDATGGGGFLGFIKGALIIFGVLIGIIIGLVLIGYIFYRFSRKKDGDMGFQDFLIDSIAHNKSSSKENTRKEAETVVKAVELKSNVDATNNILNPSNPTQNTFAPPPVPPSPLPAYLSPERTETSESSFNFPKDPLITEKIDPLADIHNDTPATVASEVLSGSELDNTTSDPLAQSNEMNESSMTSNNADGKMSETSDSDISNSTINTESSMNELIELPSSSNDTSIETNLETKGNLDDKPPEATLVEVVPVPPAPTPEPPKQEQNEIPDWLKPLPKVTTQKQDSPLPKEQKNDGPLNETIVTTDTSSILSVPHTKETEEISLNDEKGSTPGDAFPVIQHDDEELVPDWLKPLDDTHELANNDSNILGVENGNESSDEYVPPVIEIPPASTELPDWLKASVGENKEEAEKKVGSSKKKKVGKKTGTNPKNESLLSEKKANSEDIPDWLK